MDTTDTQIQLRAHRYVLHLKPRVYQDAVDIRTLVMSVRGQSQRDGMLYSVVHAPAAPGRTPDPSAAQILVQIPDAIDIELWRERTGVVDVDHEQFVLPVTRGMWGFRAQLSPTWMPRVPGRQHGPIVAITKVQDQRDWVLRKFADGGALIDPNSLTLRRLPDRFSERRNVRHNVLAVQGSARVDDPEAFLRLLANGVGRGKAFGIGMVIARPLEAQ